MFEVLQVEGITIVHVRAANKPCRDLVKARAIIIPPVKGAPECEWPAYVVVFNHAINFAM
jgi:hypothetical protein